MQKYLNRKACLCVLVVAFLGHPFLEVARKVTNTDACLTNFKGSLIKEALVVFRFIEKQGIAQGLPNWNPSTALAKLSVRSLVLVSRGIPKALIEPVKAVLCFAHKSGIHFLENLAKLAEGLWFYYVTEPPDFLSKALTEPPSFIVLRT